MESLHTLHISHQSWRLDLYQATDLVFSGVLVIGTVIIHKIDELEVVSLTTLEIVGVVSWSDLDSTSTKGHIDSDRVGNDGDSAAIERVNDEFAVEVSVSGIIGMNGNGCIS